MSLDPATILTILCSGATGVLTLAATKGIDAYVKWRRTNSEIESAACHSEDERADTWAKLVIERQQKDIESLRADVRSLVLEMNDIRKEHLNCERTASELRAEVAALRRQVNE